MRVRLGLPLCVQTAAGAAPPSSTALSRLFHQRTLLAGPSARRTTSQRHATRFFPHGSALQHRLYSFSTDHLDRPTRSSSESSDPYGSKQQGHNPSTPSSFSDDSISRRAELLLKVLELKAEGQKTGRREGEAEMKCRIYDSTGHLDERQATLRKSHICEHYGLHPRDLRKLDSNSTVIPGDYDSRFTLDACILPRERCIVVNLLYVKALISHDHIIIFDPPPPTHAVLLPSESASDTAKSDRNEPRPVLDSTSIDKTLDPHADSETADLLAATEAGKINTSPLKQNTEAKPMEVDELHALFGRAVVEQLRSGGVEGDDAEGRKGRIREGGGRRREEAFEHRALESLLLTLLAICTSELSLFLSRIRILLHDLSEDISREELKRLLNLRSAVSGFDARVRAVNEAVERVLSNDDDLAAGYLSAKASERPRGAEDHEELELLLENYSQHLEGIMSEVAGALSDVKSTQSVVELLLDSSRNMLMVLDLRVSIATLGMGTGALGAGLLGMNLANGYEDSQPAFYAMTAFLLTSSAVTMAVGWRILSRWSKVGLSGVKGMRIRRHVSESRPRMDASKPPSGA